MLYIRLTIKIIFSRAVSCALKASSSPPPQKKSMLYIRLAIKVIFSRAISCALKKIMSYIRLAIKVISAEQLVVR